MNDKYKLIGFINILQIRPGFIYPVFQHNKKLYFQHGEKNKLSAFIKIEKEVLDEIIVYEGDKNIEINLDSNPIYAYQRKNGEVFCGNAAVMSKYLKGIKTKSKSLAKEIHDFQISVTKEEGTEKEDHTNDINQITLFDPDNSICIKQHCNSYLSQMGKWPNSVLSDPIINILDEMEKIELDVKKSAELYVPLLHDSIKIDQSYTNKKSCIDWLETKEKEYKYNAFVIPELTLSKQNMVVPFELSLIPKYLEKESFFRQAKAVLILARIIKRKGDLFFQIGNNNSATQAYDEAIFLLRNEKDEAGLGRVLKAKGDMLQAIGTMDEALEAYSEAEELLRSKRKSIDWLGRAFREVADSLEKMNQSDDVEWVFDEIIGMLRNEEKIGLGQVLRAKGDLLHAIGRTDEALDAYIDAERVFLIEKENWDLNVKKRTWNGLLQAIDDQIDNQVYIGYSSKAEELFRYEKHEWDLAQVLKSKGDILIDKGKISAAKKSYAESYDIIKKETNILKKSSQIKEFDAWINRKQNTNISSYRFDIYEDELIRLNIMQAIERMEQEKKELKTLMRFED